MTHPVVQLQSVSKIFGTGEMEVRALREVSVEIQSGEFVSVAGPSGCGKSTLLHLIGALDQPTSGTVKVGGEDLSQFRPHQLADLRLEKIGFVFQSFNLVPVLSAAENVQLVLQLQGISTKERNNRAHEILDSLSLAEVAHRRPGELSGGQQQRVAVARALAGDPILLLADEPSANLDSQTTRELCQLLQTINRDSGLTIVTATHDPMVMEFTSRQVRLEDGSVISDTAS